MSKLRKSLIVLACFASIALAPSSSPGASTVRVGIVLPITGKHAKFGEIEKLSFEMATDEINKNGGINGHPMELVIEDTTGKPDVGRSAAEKLITHDRVVILGGGYSSSVTAAIVGVAINNGFPFLVNTGSADIITQPTAHTPSGKRVNRLLKELANSNDPARISRLEKKIDALRKRADREVEMILPRYAIFRLNPPVSEFADGLKNFLLEVVKPETAVILHENSLFGTKGAAAFAKSAKQIGTRVLFTESYDSGAIDFKPLMAKVRNANPDLVYMVSYILDASLLMNQSMELKLNPKLFAGAAAGFTLPEFRKTAGVASEKVVSATLWHQSLPYPGAMEYFDKFRDRYGRDTEYHGAEAYAAAFVIADALRRAKSHSPSDVKKALEQTDMMTVFGPVKFISYGRKIHQNKLDTYVVQWIDGKLEIIWPPKLAKKKYVFPIDWIKERQ